MPTVPSAIDGHKIVTNSLELPDIKKTHKLIDFICSTVVIFLHRVIP